MNTFTKKLLLLILLLASISALLVAKGDRDDDGAFCGAGGGEHGDEDCDMEEHEGYGKWERKDGDHISYGRDGKGERRYEETFQNLSHGTLSDAEGADLQAVYKQSALVSSIQYQLSMLESEGSYEHNKKNEIEENSFFLKKVAASYDLTLDEISPDTAYESGKMKDIIIASEKEIIAMINLSQKAFEQADDEDLKTSYLLMQKRHIGKLYKLSNIMLSQGVTPSQAIVTITDENNTTLSSKDITSYPQSLQDEWNEKSEDRDDRDRDHRGREKRKDKDGNKDKDRKRN